LLLKSSRTYKNIYEISATALSLPDQQYLACGLVNGAVTVWSTNTANIIYNTDKHQGAVTALRFFEGWKLISGSSRGEVQIDNIVTLANEVKRTNIFESKVDYPIANIRVCELGLAFVIDANANLRVYDLWRNEKIVKVQSCNSFAQLENRGKRWVPSSAIEPAVGIYTNNGTALLRQTSRPSSPPTGQASAPGSWRSQNPSGRR
jgi:WD40 repeat protein